MYYIIYIDWRVYKSDEVLLSLRFHQTLISLNLGSNEIGISFLFLKNKKNIFFYFLTKNIFFLAFSLKVWADLDLVENVKVMVVTRMATATILLVKITHDVPLTDMNGTNIQILLSALFLDFFPLFDFRL